MATGSKTDYLYQTVGFHFKVIFEGLPGGKEVDVRFQSVSGLDVQLETETIKEGGQNHFEHTVPVRTKFSSTLVLKRGLIPPKASGLTDWCLQAFNDRVVVPLDLVSVHLLDEKHKPCAKWDLEHVWPKSWKVAELNAERSEVLIEQIELHFNRFTLSKV